MKSFESSKEFVFDDEVEWESLNKGLIRRTIRYYAQTDIMIDSLSLTKVRSMA